MKMIKFYDTCSLLLAGNKVFESKDYVVISSITLKELERIKTSSNKDMDIKYQARHLLSLLDEQPYRWSVVIHKPAYEQKLIDKGFEINDDTRILSDALYYQSIWTEQKTEFITNDLSLKCIAAACYPGPVNSIKEDNDDYCGYKEVVPDSLILSEFYQEPTKNVFELLPNEYIVIKDSGGNIIDVRLWTGQEYRFLDCKPCNSKWFGKMTPKDVYQKMALDSFYNNQLTYIGGPAGSGKTALSLGYFFSELDKGHIDQIVIFCNPVVARNAAKLGYYPGSMLEKVLSTQTGNILASKLGDMSEVERLINERKIVIVPAGDARGYQTLPNSGVYIMEAQNYDTTLLRMLLQRIDDSSKVICDGDKLEQTDLAIYAGNNNGLKKMSKVFRGQDYYGQVELKQIYRSKIADKAQEMR